LLVETLNGLQAGNIQPKSQDHAQATLAPILKKEDGKIDFGRSAREIHNRLRGFQPWPGAFTTFRGKNLQIAQASAREKSIPPGELLIEGNYLFAGCAEKTALEILELQPEGKKRMLAKDFIHGYHPKTGEKLGTEN